MTDRSGGIHDRTTFLERAESEVRRARRYGRTLTVLLLEVDDRETLLAERGRAWVDILMDVIALACHQGLRDPDILGRYSDGILAFLLPEADESAGVRLAARLTRDLSEVHPPIAGGAVSFTVSAGVAASVGEGAELSEILTAAKRQLSAAHAAGGGQIKGCFVGDRREHIDEALARLGRRKSDRAAHDDRAAELTQEELDVLLKRRPE